MNAVRSVARSHIGSVRAVNEDRVLNCAERGLWAVADGMGGHSMGDVAAEMVVGALTGLAAGEAPLSPASIEAALIRVNAKVYNLNAGAPGRSGSTVAGLHLSGDTAHVFWAGDSRVYRQRHGAVTLLTHDDRLVQEMIDAGVIDAQQARVHPSSTVITRAIGATEAMEISSRHDRAIDGDTYLLCSDGLTDLIDTDQISRTLSLDHAEAADGLIQAAMRAGGHDNISVVIVSFGQRHRSADEETLDALSSATRS